MPANTHHKTSRRAPRPRRSDILTSPLVIAFNDWRYGTQNGRADVVGHDMTDAGGVPHAERLIDAQGERIAADQRRALLESRTAIQEQHKTAALSREQAEREVARLHGEDTERAQDEAAFGHRQGLGRSAYGLMVAVLFGVTVPLDYGVATWLPLPPLGQWLLTVGIGAAMVIVAHLAAKKIEDLEESHAKRKERGFTYRKDQIAVVAGLVAGTFALIVTALWRGQVFSVEAKTAGTAIPVGIVSVALGALALLAFVAAVLAGMSFHGMAPLRAVRRARARLKATRLKWQEVADQSAAREREAEVELASLYERERAVMDAIRFWADERKARLHQRTAWVSLRERRKHAAGSSSRTPVGRSRASIG